MIANGVTDNNGARYFSFSHKVTKKHRELLVQRIDGMAAQKNNEYIISIKNQQRKKVRYVTLQ